MGPHIEESVDPANIYGWSKFLGEQQLDPNRHLIIRTNFVGKSMIPCKKKSFSDWIIENFCEKNKINLHTDIQFNPVHACDIANLICHVLTRNGWQVFTILVGIQYRRQIWQFSFPRD